MGLVAGRAAWVCSGQKPRNLACFDLTVDMTIAGTRYKGVPERIRRGKLHPELAARGTTSTPRARTAHACARADARRPYGKAAAPTRKQPEQVEGRWIWNRSALCSHCLRASS